MVSQMEKIQAVIGKNFAPTIIPLIANARHSISILVFDWRWYPNEPASPIQLFNQAIIQAKRKGVKIRALVNMYSIVGELRALGIDCRKVVGKDLLHAKLIIIDDSIAVVGSHNFTQSAFGKNFECSVITTDEATVSAFNDYFEVIFNYHGESKG